MSAQARGFRAPAAGTAMCSHLVAWDAQGRLPKPRACARAAADDSPYCAMHTRMMAGKAQITVREGGFCLFCAAPARTFASEGMSVALCGRHGKALERALREGR